MKPVLRPTKPAPIPDGPIVNPTRQEQAMKKHKPISPRLKKVLRDREQKRPAKAKPAPHQFGKLDVRDIQVKSSGLIDGGEPW